MLGKLDRRSSGFKTRRLLLANPAVAVGQQVAFPTNAGSRGSCFPTGSMGQGLAYQGRCRLTAHARRTGPKDETCIEIAINTHPYISSRECSDQISCRFILYFYQKAVNHSQKPDPQQYDLYRQRYAVLCTRRVFISFNNSFLHLSMLLRLQVSTIPPPTLSRVFYPVFLYLETFLVHSKSCQPLEPSIVALHSPCSFAFTS